MSTVATLLYYIKDDIKESGTTRDAEIQRYMDRVIRQAIMPTLIRFRSTIGVSEWNTDEVTENVREVTLPTSFLAMHSLYCIDSERSSTIGTGSTSTSFVLDSSASDDDDTYNSFQIRITSGTGDGQQTLITDYDGDTVTATVSTVTTAPASADTYIIFKEPSEGDELKQREANWVRTNYNSIGAVECYGIEDTTIVLGAIPDSTTRVLWGWYYAIPTALSATTSTVPFSGIFDDVIIEYCSMRCLNRDEYNVQMERTLLDQAIDGVIGIVAMRRSRSDRQPKMAGSKDL